MTTSGATIPAQADAEDDPPARVLVISMAASLDRFAEVEGFTVGAINRPAAVTPRAGGKGLNAARAAGVLGVRAATVALLGGETGRAVARHAAMEGLAGTWVWADAETRQCLCLHDVRSRRLTEVYEPVLPVAATEWRAFAEVSAREIDRLAGETTRPDVPGVVVLSGRTPPGADPDVPAELVRAARAAGLRVLLDSDGAALGPAVAAGPSIVKVNGAEAASVVGFEVADRASATRAAHALRALGAGAAVVTLGADGWVCADEQGVVREDATPPLTDALPVGSGDAMLGGLAAALATGRSLPAALRLGTAAARANAEVLVPGAFSRARVAELTTA